MFSWPMFSSFLLQLHGGSDVFELLLQFVGLLFLQSFLDGLGSAIHEILGLLKAEACGFP